MADDGGPLLEKEVKENSNGYYQRLNKLACSNLLGNSFPSMFLLFFVFFFLLGEREVSLFANSQMQALDLQFATWKAILYWPTKLTLWPVRMISIQFLIFTPQSPIEVMRVKEMIQTKESHTQRKNTFNFFQFYLSAPFS